jgi:hypothetical protein
VRRGRHRIALLVAAALASSVLAGCGGSGGALAGRRANPIAPTPVPADGASTLRSVLRDTLAAGWAEVRIVGTIPGAGSATHQVFVDSSGPDRGVQHITIGQLHGSVILLRRRAYVQGSATALESIFELPADAAARLAGRWVEVTPADPEYPSIAAGITLRSVMAASAPSAPVRETRSRLGDRRVLVLSGPLPAAAALGTGTATLYAATGTPPLPIEVVERGSDGIEQVTFSGLGRPVSVTVPPDAVALPAPNLGAGSLEVVASLRPWPDRLIRGG